MFGLGQKLVGLGIAVVLATGLAACGGSGGAHSTVAVVGKSTITQSTLNHWMSGVAGSAYLQIIGSRAPAGLVSDPVNYRTCTSAVGKAIALSAPAEPTPSSRQLRVKCAQLNSAIREQALSALISALWRTQEGAELGVAVSDREVTQELNRTIATQYSNPAQFRKYLADTDLSLSDYRYLLKRDILANKFALRLKARVTQLGGSNQTLARVVKESVAKWTARTSCSPGYTTWQCKQYRSSSNLSPSTAKVLEEVKEGTS